MSMEDEAREVRARGPVFQKDLVIANDDGKVYYFKESDLKGNLEDYLVTRERLGTISFAPVMNLLRLGVVSAAIPTPTDWKHPLTGLLIGAAKTVEAEDKKNLNLVNGAPVTNVEVPDMAKVDPINCFMTCYLLNLGSLMQDQFYQYHDQEQSP